MKNICIFDGDMSNGGGTERITQVLANELSKNQNYNVTVLSLNNKDNVSSFPLEDAVELHSLKQAGTIKKMIELRKFLRKKRIDVIIDVDVMLGIFSLPATFLSKTKMISWEMFNIRSSIGNKYTNVVRKICLRKSAYYVNQTKGDMEAFQNEMPVKCPITYIYNPCEIDFSYNDYNLNSKTIMTAGHFFHTKGYDMAIEVAKLVFEKHPDWRWEFYGDGKELEKCRKKVIDYRLENNVIFCGRTSDMLSAYKKSSIYVMTSRSEGFGLVLTEAKSCNLPTIAFDIDFGPREIIDNNISGFLVEPFNFEQMANKICYLIENEKTRKEFSNRAKDNCNKFLLEEFVNKWICILNSI